MKTFKLFIILLTVIGFTSCEDVIQVKLDEGQPMVTVDAFINDMRAQQKVRLTYTDGYFSQKPNDPITGATVQIRDLTAGIDYIFTDNNDGNYVYEPVDTFKVGHEYELTVTHQGDVFKSTSRINRTTHVDSLLAEYKEGGGLANAKEGYKFAFLGFDPPGDTIDYYWIKSYRNGVFFNKGGDINIAANGAYGEGADGFPFITPIAQSITPFGEVFNKYDVCRVEIHSINLETFNFLIKCSLKQLTQDYLQRALRTSKPILEIQPAPNVKVVGWFCMSAVGFKEAVAQ